jgi:hypothetical protein
MFFLNCKYSIKRIFRFVDCVHIVLIA